MHSDNFGEQSVLVPASRLLDENACILSKFLNEEPLILEDDHMSIVLGFVRNSSSHFWALGPILPSLNALIH